jgi:hypothetical protein
MTAQTTQERLEELRAAIQAERISYGEIAELQSLAEHIDPSDVELLEWAGVDEFDHAAITDGAVEWDDARAMDGLPQESQP